MAGWRSTCKLLPERKVFCRQGRRAVRHADAKHLLKLKMKRESMKIERYEVRERP